MATYTLTGPNSGVQQTASTNFTVTMDNTAITGSVVVVPNDGGAGGSFSPASLTFNTANQALNFVYTPLKTGNAVISTTNNANYVNPASITYVVSLNKDVAINRLLYVLHKAHGYTFPYNELSRVGGFSDADIAGLRASFLRTLNKCKMRRSKRGRKPVCMVTPTARFSM